MKFLHNGQEKITQSRKAQSVFLLKYKVTIQGNAKFFFRFSLRNLCVSASLREILFHSVLVLAFPGWNFVF